MRDELPVEELEAMANNDIGEVLRRTRIHYGQTLEDVEVALRIRSCQIDAIECGDMSALPGRVYAIGFVRSYAEYLGIDGGKVVQLFRAQYMDGQDNSTLTFSVPASETKTPAFWFVALSLLISSVFFTGWHVMNRPEYSSELMIKKVPEEIKSHVNQDILVSAPVVEVVGPFRTVPVENIVENMGGDESQNSGVILNILDSSWVEIKNGEGEIIVSNILEKGEQYFVPDSPGLSMSLGNAANIEIVIDGRALKPLGKDGDVRRDIPLDTVYLKTLDFQDAQDSKVLELEKN